MKKLFPVFLVTILLIMGCSSTPKLVSNPDGTKVKVSFLLNPGMEQIETTDQEDIDQRTQLANFIETDMKRLLTNAGYEPTVIENSEAYDASGGYLLNMRVLKYSAGNKALRMTIGFGAGATSMDTVTDFKKGDQVIFSKEQSIGSGRDWRHVVRKTNVLVIKDMSANFQ